MSEHNYLCSDGNTVGATVGILRNCVWIRERCKVDRRLPLHLFLGLAFEYERNDKQRYASETACGAAWREQPLDEGYPFYVRDSFLSLQAEPRVVPGEMVSPK